MFYNDNYQNILTSDLFGTLPKVEAIKHILTVNTQLVQANQMIALYGKWGSGKTSVMKTLEKQLEGYNIIFFEAWKYENDSNIAISLLETMLEKLNDSIDNEVLEDIKLIGRTVFTFAKNLLFNTKGTIGMEVDFGQAAKETEKEVTAAYRLDSYYHMTKDFEEVFSKAISTYIKNKPLIIMIDDLDRCEPQNILNLLSAIKHFFLCDQLIYLCGIDKKAVENAIKIHYGNYINADDYLDKIFNISFNMAEANLEGIIEDFSKRICKDTNQENLIRIMLLDLLNSIEFKNPRKVKRALNKLSYFIELNSIQKDGIGNEQGFELVFLLFISILFEFEKDTYNSLINYKYKIEALGVKLEGDGIYLKPGTVHRKANLISDMMALIPELTLNSTTLKSFLSYIEGNENRDNSIIYLLLWLTPMDINEIKLPRFNVQEAQKELDIYIAQFKLSSNKVMYNFSVFLLNYLNNHTIQFEIPVYKILKFVGEFS